MTHPLEQLADAVDGTLAPDDRAALDDHLRVVRLVPRRDRRRDRRPHGPPGDARVGCARPRGRVHARTDRSPHAPTRRRSGRRGTVRRGPSSHPRSRPPRSSALVALVVPRLGSCVAARPWRAGGPAARTRPCPAQTASSGRDRLRRCRPRSSGGNARHDARRRLGLGFGAVGSRGRRRARHGAWRRRARLRGRSHACGRPSPASPAGSCSCVEPRSRVSPRSSASCSRAPSRPSWCRSGSRRSTTARVLGRVHRVTSRLRRTPGHARECPCVHALWEDLLRPWPTNAT